MLCRLEEPNQRHSRSHSPGEALHTEPQLSSASSHHHYHSPQQQHQLLNQSNNRPIPRGQSPELLNTQGRSRSRTTERQHQYPESSPGGRASLSEQPQSQRRSVEDRKKLSVGVSTANTVSTACKKYIVSLMPIANNNALLDMQYVFIN